MSRIAWKGPGVLSSVRAATKAAIDETTAEAVRDAQGSHWWGSRSGNLQSQIVNEPAQLSSTGRLTGKFGSTQHQGFYGLFLERRTPFLRPAADRTFRQLATNIRKRVM